MRVKAIHKCSVKIKDGCKWLRLGHMVTVPPVRTMQSMKNASTVLLVIFAGSSTLMACKPMTPRPAVAAPAQQEAAPAATANRDPATDPTPGDPNWESGSALGKARDAAVRTKVKVDAYQKEVSKQADEVFKNP
jgi:hypothetical protein